MNADYAARISTVSSSIGYGGGSVENGNQENKHVCSTNALESHWKNNFAAHSEDYNQYYGDQKTGLSRFYPGFLQTSCPTTYDPRVRPWYSSAASGPKDVILVLDTSGSMSYAGRMTKTKNAAKAVINMLSWADHATVIGFNSGVKTMTDTYLMEATAANKILMNNFIDSLYANGPTNYEVAF